MILIKLPSDNNRCEITKWMATSHQLYIDKYLPSPKSVQQIDLESKAQNSKKKMIFNAFCLLFAPFRFSCNAYLLLFKQNSLIRFIQFQFSVGALITVNNGSESIQTASIPLSPFYQSSILWENENVIKTLPLFRVEAFLSETNFCEWIWFNHQHWIFRWNFCGFPFEFEKCFGNKIVNDLDLGVARLLLYQ